jgi:hypothetical protein
MSAPPIVHPPAPPGRPRSSTFSSIRLAAETLPPLPFDQFVSVVVGKLAELKSERAAFYEGLRRSNSRWANGARAVLAILGALALLLTSIAAAIRLAPNTLPFITGAEADRPVLVGILVIYAVMGAISFYEKGSDKTSSYFRQIATILAIRDLWTRLQFALAKELMPLKGSVDPATTDPARLRILALGEAFCVDLDKASTGELAEFRTEFMTSLADLEAASKKGTDEMTKLLDERLKAAEKAAVDAKTAADKAASDARAAVKAVEEAARPGFLNLTVVGEFDDEVVIAVGGAEAVRSRGKQIALDRMPPGPARISARASKAGKPLETSVTVDVKPGVQELKLTLS